MNTYIYKQIEVYTYNHSCNDVSDEFTEFTLNTLTVAVGLLGKVLAWDFPAAHHF